MLMDIHTTTHVYACMTAFTTRPLPAEGLWVPPLLLLPIATTAARGQGQGLTC